MNKVLLALGVSAVLAMSVSAQEPTTINGRMDRVEEVVSGHIGDGSLVERLDAIDAIVYGKGNKTAEGLNERVSHLYADVVNSGLDGEPSISARINAMEYYLNDEIKKEPLENRIEDLEQNVLGKIKSGAIDERALALEKEIYGDQHPEMRGVVLPAKTVFKISLNENVSTRENEVGDPVTFTVEEDVKVGDVLVLPRGAQGSGIVTKVEKPKSFGRSGKLDISFDQVFSLDDDVIPTELGPEAREKLKREAAAVGASAIGALALGPIGLIGGYFVKGSDVELSAGSVLYIETKSDVKTRGIVMEAGPSVVTLRERVTKKIPADKKADTEEKSAVGKNELKFVNESGAPVTVDKKADIGEAVKEKTEKVEKADDDSASVVIVRNA